MSQGLVIFLLIGTAIVFFNLGFVTHGFFAACRRGGDEAHDNVIDLNERRRGRAE